MKKLHLFLMFLVITASLFIREKSTLKVRPVQRMEVNKPNHRSNLDSASAVNPNQNKTTRAEVNVQGQNRLDYSFHQLPSLEEIERSLEGKTTRELTQLLRKSKRLIVAKDLLKKANTGIITQAELENFALEMRKQTVILFLLSMESRS